MDQNLLEIKGAWSPEEDEMLQNLLKKHGLRNWPFTPEEGESILRAHARFGNNCWGAISNLLSGRTYDEVEYYLNLTLKRKSSLVANEDITIAAHSIYIPPPSFSDINRGKGNSYIHDGNISHEVGGDTGRQAPSFSDIMGFNMSLG
nr:hypothetical protein [Tanacetum cinerariifolium]